MADFMSIGVIRISRSLLIQSSLSRARGPKDTTDMGGVKGNSVTTHEQHVSCK